MLVVACNYWVVRTPVGGMNKRHIFDRSDKSRYGWCSKCGAPPQIPCFDKRTIFPCPETGIIRRRVLTWIHEGRELEW